MSPEPKRQPERRSRQRRFLRALLVLLLLVVVALAGLWGWLESPPGQERARRWLETRSTALLERGVRIESLDLDLVPFDALLTGVEIDGAPGSDEPLLRATSVRVRLRPWALLSRQLHLRSVDIVSPAIHWDVTEGSNLALEASGGSGLGVTIESLRIDDGSLDLNHRRWNLDTSLAAVSLQLQPVENGATAAQQRSGVLRIGGGGLRITAPPAATIAAAPDTIELVAAELPFTVDNRVLRLDGARATLGGSELTASGTLTDWRRVALSVSGSLDVRDLVALGGVSLSDSDSGTVTLAATLTYGPDPLRVTGALSSEEMTLAGVRSTGLAANVDASADLLIVDDLRVALFDGDVTARLEIDLAARPRVWQLSYDAGGVDLNALSNSPALPGFRFAGIAAASGDLSWQAPIRDTISGSGSIDLSLPAGTLTRIGVPTAPAAPSPAGPDAANTPRVAPREPGTALPQRVAPSLPLPVAAHAEFELTAGTLVVRNATASLPNTEASINGSLGRDGAIAATLRVQSDDLRMLDRFFNQVRRFRGEQPVPQPLGIAGSGLAVATLGGTLEAPTVDGNLEARSLVVADNRIGDIDGNLRLAGAALEIVDLQLRREGGTGQGEGRFRIGQRVDSGPDYTFGLRLQGFPMEVDLPQLGTPLAVAGRASGEIALSGSYQGSAIGLVTLQGEGVRLNALEDLRADVRIRLTADEWVAERFELAGSRGSISVSGAWQRIDDTVQAQLDAFDVDASIIGDLSGADLPVAGVVQVQAQLTGPFATPNAAATLRWTEAGAYGANLGSVALSAELRAGSMAISALGRSDATSPAVPPPTPRASGGDVAIPLGVVPPAGWAATLSADFDAPQRATLRAAGDADLLLALVAAQGYDAGEGLEVDGTLEVSGSGFLGDWTGWGGTAVFSDFSLSRPDLAFSIPAPMRLGLSNEILHIDLPELVSDAGSLRMNGSIDLTTGHWLEASATGQVSLAVLGTLSDKVEAGGTLTVDMQASGEVLAGEVAGSFELRDVSVARAGWPWEAQGVDGTIVLTGDYLDLVDVRGMVSERPFAVDGRLPLAALAGEETSDPFSLDVVVDSLPLRPLWEKAGPVHELITGGEAAVTASIRGRGANWRTYEGRIDIRTLRVELKDLDLSMPQATWLTLHDGQLDVGDPIVLRGPGTDLQVTGAFLLGPFRLDAQLQGAANLDPLNAVTRGWGIAGRADIDVHVSGDPPELAYDGTARVTSGLLNAPVLQPIENITAELTLDNRLVRIDSFVGSLGDSSSASTNVSGDGEIQLVNSVPQRFVLNANVDEAQMRFQPGVRVTASADLVLEGTFERSIISGTMNISEGEYTRRWESEDELLSLGDASVGGIDHPLARAVSLDIDVIAPGELRMVNNVADLELSADLQVRGTLANPVILGSTTVLDGSVTFRDQRYRFLRGSVEFQNPLRTEPSVDIAIETSIRQYLVTLNASGSPARGDMNATFVSQPPLSDLQLIQLLTVGDAPDENVRQEEANIGAVGAQATSFLTRQYLNQVERGAQRVFGIDRFRVDPAVVNGSGDPTARVTIGKQVTPDLWVSWTTVLGTTDEQLVQLEYQLTRGIRLTATREDNGAIGVDIRFDRRFR